MTKESNTSIPTSEQQITSVKNFVLDGVSSLRVEKVINEEVEVLNYPLREVTREQLGEAREKGISSFVLKVDEKFYYTEIPVNMNFTNSNLLGKHKCSATGHECYRLSAASDKNGGCARVRDRYACIENYNFITCGYETFHTNHHSFFIASCSHYEKCPPRQ